MQLGPVMALVSGPTIGDAIADPANEISRLVAREADDAKLIDELFLRVLNRPATPAEIDACRADVEAVESDHRALAAQLGGLETDFALKRPKLERDRESAVAEAQAELAAYEKELAPKRAAAEAERTAKVAKLEADLKAFEPQLATKLADWEKKQSTAVRWLPLEAKSLKDSNGATLKPEADGSVVASGSNGKGVITFTAETELTGITGFRLEMIADARLPKGGPGRAPDGNFVLNEFTVNAAPKADAKTTKQVLLENPVADFTQANFNIRKTIDGTPNRQEGWAVAPAFGATHWATFETKEPLGAEGGTVLTITMTHQKDDGFMPGRFRISVTRVPKPVGLGLAEEFRAALEVVPELRTQAQRDLLLNYFRQVDPDWRKRADALAQGKAPLPPDAKLQQLKDRLAEANKPVAVDPQLAQLRKDLEMSVKQAAARRLTAAQDVAWALINSPAFLFNH
jgi:hypothetical protein